MSWKCNLLCLYNYIRKTKNHCHLKINCIFVALWLRLYAIKLEQGCYIITGGAIKLTKTMQEREHTLRELNNMERVRNLLLQEGAIDADGFADYMSEINSDYLYETENS